MNYKYEAIDISMAHSLSYSCSYKQKKNIVWNQEEKWVGYTFESIVIIEKLNLERNQKFLKEGNDTLSDLKLSQSGKMLMAYTYTASIDGLPMIYIWDATTLKKISQISINQKMIVSADFSPNSNMLLVVSFDDTEDENPNSIVAIWDFTDGNCEPLCRSHIPFEIKGAVWNYFLKNLEFTTWNDTNYYFWKVTDELSLQYQEGTKDFDIKPEDKSDYHKSVSAVKVGKDEGQAKISSMAFSYPIKHLQTVFLLIGLSNGYIWSVDSRTNSLISQVKISDTEITNIDAKIKHIIISKSKDNSLSCWRIPEDDALRQKGNNLFAGSESNLLLDGETKCMFLNEYSAEGFVTTKSGTIWFVDWELETTLKINSFHINTSSLCKFGFKYVSPSEFEISEKKGEELDYEFDKNYYVMSSSSDGVLKLWNMHTSEQMMQFVVPKEKCTSLAIHHFKPYVVAGFTDGYVRFFEIDKKNSSLGRCLICENKDSAEFVSEKHCVVELKIMPSGNHILAATSLGLIIIIFVERWEPLAIRIENLVCVNAPINNFDISYIEPYNKFLVGTKNGKIIMYNKRNFNALNQETFNMTETPKYNFMDCFNMLDYITNNYAEATTLTLDHYYSVKKREKVENVQKEENECMGVFLPNDMTLYISFIKCCNIIFFRNFELRQIVKRVSLELSPTNIKMFSNGKFFLVTMNNNTYRAIDTLNEENVLLVNTSHEEITQIDISPNGRYILTGGNKGDVILWKAKILSFSHKS